jgi:hypothetical protein
LNAAARWTLACAGVSAILLLIGVARAAEPIRIVETRTVESDTPKFGAVTHGLTLHAYLFRGSRWTVDEVSHAITTGIALLGQCGIALTAAELHAIDAPRRYHDYQTPLSRELVRAIRVSRPAVFFVEDTKNAPAFDAEAIGSSNARTRPELANTVWIAYGARDLAYVIAHEMVHVLADSGAHSTEPRNLMRDETAPDNDRLSTAQCDLMRSRGAANGLLHAK